MIETWNLIVSQRASVSTYQDKKTEVSKEEVILSVNVQQGTVKGEKEEEGERRMQEQKHS